MTNKRHRDLLIELLRLYDRYGENAFRELARALRAGEIMDEIIQLSDAVSGIPKRKIGVYKAQASGEQTREAKGDVLWNESKPWRARE